MGFINGNWAQFYKIMPMFLYGGKAVEYFTNKSILGLKKLVKPLKF